MGKHFVSNQTDSVRMFKSNFMESLSKVHWTVPLFIFIPIILFFIFRSVFISYLGTINTILFYFGGLFIWTIIEYILHRFVFHYHPKSEWGKKIHWTFHGVHHDYPQDRFRLVMPPSVSLPLAAIFYLIFHTIFGITYTPALFAGFLTGYLIYDIMHYALHHFGFRNKILLKLKQHHMKHHYADPDEGFGVSSPIWDYVFGTRFSKK